MKRLTLIAALAIAGAAHATDGVIEINHARALAGGVTPGDTPGYPVTISQAGSYRLTSNLTQPDVSTDVIRIAADNVTLDLNGFTISGSNVCTISGVWPTKTMACGGAGTGVGVMSTANGHISVLNGSIAGVANDCVQLANWAPSGVVAQRVENVSVSHCGANGISAGYGLISRVVASHCRSAGINLLTGQISNATAEANGSVGISGVSLMVTNSTASSNLENGFYTEGRVSRSFAFDNQGDGIYVHAGADDNRSYTNHGHGIFIQGGVASGNTITSNDRDGIYASPPFNGESIALLGNVMGRNTGFGITVTSGVILMSQNLLDNNNGVTGPQIQGTPKTLGNNFCNGSAC